MVRSGTLVRRKILSQMEAPEVDYFSSKPIDAINPVMWTENKSVSHIPFPGSNRLCQQRIKEEEVDTDSDSDLEWGVQENMKLFEVSAKDDHGVQELFEHLIRCIITKRSVIEKEREQRERDSVYLNTDIPSPSWAAVADEEEARQATAQQWSCC